MSGEGKPGLLAIDVGTSRVKLGWFPAPTLCEADKPGQLPIAAPRLPEPAETFAYRHGSSEVADLAAWLEMLDTTKARTAMATVNPDAACEVARFFAGRGMPLESRLALEDLPLRAEVAEPDKLGIDRALAAVAVNRVRAPAEPAIVVSLGTACTVNFLSEDGTFQGGAILPGLSMALRALHQATASLPLLTPEGFSLPAHAVGKNTADAMGAGVFWGMVGAIEKLIAEQSRTFASPPQIFLTGGDAPMLKEALAARGRQVRLMPHLVLSGIAIACEAQL